SLATFSSFALVSGSSSPNFFNSLMRSSLASRSAWMAASIFSTAALSSGLCTVMAPAPLLGFHALRQRKEGGGDGSRIEVASVPRGIEFGVFADQRKQGPHLRAGITSVTHDHSL